MQPLQRLKNLRSRKWEVKTENERSCWRAFSPVISIWLNGPLEPTPTQPWGQVEVKEGNNSLDIRTCRRDPHSFSSIASAAHIGMCTVDAETGGLSKNTALCTRRIWSLCLEKVGEPAWVSKFPRLTSCINTAVSFQESFWLQFAASNKITLVIHLLFELSESSSSFWTSLMPVLAATRTFWDW